MFKVMKEEAPNYLINLFPKCERNTRTRNNSIPTCNCRTNDFKYSFFPPNLNDWFNLDLNIRNSESILIFKSKSLSFIRPVQTNIYNIFEPKGLTFLTRPRLGLSHINEHRFRRSFQDCLNPLYSCSLETEDTSHYLLHCHHFSRHRAGLMSSVKSICDHFESMSVNVKENLLLHDDSQFDENNKIKVILNGTINYMKILKYSLVLFFINVSLLINVEIFTSNSGHLFISIFLFNYC